MFKKILMKTMIQEEKMKMKETKMGKIIEIIVDSSINRISNSSRNQGR